MTVPTLPLSVRRAYLRAIVHGRARVALNRIARRDAPLPPLSPEMERAVIAAVNEARRQGHGHGAVTITSDNRGGLHVQRPHVDYVQAPTD